MEKTEKVITRIDTYLRLLQYKYTELEKLSRLEVLNDYYKSKNINADFEQLQCKMECAEQLKKKKFSLPLKVRGVFLTEGRPAMKFYSKEEIIKAVDNPINQTFPLMLDHCDNEAGKIIGGVDKISYDEQLKGIRWWGHVNNETFARNILDGLIKEVSATIYSASEYTESFGLIGKDLIFKELSLVIKGAEPKNNIQVDE